MGATFAYFSLTTTNGEGTTSSNISGEVGSAKEKLAQIILSAENPKLYLKLSDVNMAYSEQGDYYATNTETTPVKGAEQTHNIAKVEISNTQAGAEYECTGTFSITPSGALFAEGSAISSADGTLTIAGADANVTVESGEFTLDQFKNNTAKSVTAKFTKLSSDNTEEHLTAKLVFHNRNATQNDLAGKDLSITIASTAFSCDTTTAPTAGD